MHHLRMTAAQRDQWRGQLAKHKEELTANLARAQRGPGDMEKKRKERHDTLKSKIKTASAPSARLSDQPRPRRHTALSSRMMTAADLEGVVAAEEEEKEEAKTIRREDRHAARWKAQQDEQRRREESAERRSRQPQRHEIAAAVDRIGEEVLGEMLNPMVRDAVAAEMHAEATLQVLTREPTSSRGDIAAAEARVTALRGNVRRREEEVSARSTELTTVAAKLAEVSAIHESLEAKMNLLPPSMLANDRAIVARKIKELSEATAARAPKRARSPSPYIRPVISEEENKRRQREYQSEMAASRAAYSSMPVGTSTTETDLQRLQIHREIESTSASVRDTKRRLTTMQHDRAKAVGSLRDSTRAAADAAGVRAGMRAPDLAAEFVRAPWWTSPSPDASVKSDPKVAARVREIAKRKRRTAGLPSWAKPGASNDQFKRGIDQIGSKSAVMDARNALAAYIENVSTDEKGSELYLKMSARDRDLEALMNKFDVDEDFRQMSTLAAGRKKRKKRKKPRTPSPTPKPAKRAKPSGSKVKEGEHEKPATGFDNRFFV